MSTYAKYASIFLIFLYQLSKEATYNWNLFATQFVMTFESPKSCKCESCLDLAKYNKAQSARSSPWVLFVPLRQPIFNLYTLESLHFNTTPAQHFNAAS